MQKRLTIAEVAELWGVSVGHVHSLVSYGHLRAVNISLNPAGRPTWRIDDVALREFEESRRKAPAAPPPTRRKNLAGSVKQFV